MGTFEKNTMTRDHSAPWLANIKANNKRTGEQLMAATQNVVPVETASSQNDVQNFGQSLTRLNVRPDPRLEKRSKRKCLLMTSCGSSFDNTDSLSQLTTTVAKTDGEIPSSSSRKRVLSSHETPERPTKRLNKVPSDVPETTCSTSVISSAVSRELATVETCNQVMLQQPRDVRISCTPGQDGHSQVSCLEKRVRKKKTRRGRKKKRKFVPKVTSAHIPPCDQQQVATPLNIDSKDDHGTVVKPGYTSCDRDASDIGKCGYVFNQRSSIDASNHNNPGDIADCGILTVGDSRDVPLANHGIISNAFGHQEEANIDNNATLVDNIHEAQTNPTVVQHMTGINCSHSNEFNGTKPDDQNRKDLFVLIEKGNGVAYAVSKGEDRVLGRGGFGIVYKGFKLEGATKIPVAIKVVEKSSIQCFVEDDELGLVPEEVAMLNKIKGHPNVIELIDYVQIYDYVAIIMDRPENCKDLFDILAQQTFAMSEIHARKVMKQLTDVLLEMEKKGIVHRDIKAENILVDLDNEQVKLIDFGLATTCRPGKTMKKFCGTREHTPPEYLLNGEYDGPKETVWTLGLLLYYLVCGDEPFCSFLETTIKPLRVPSYLSTDLKDLLSGMLRKNPNQRLTLEQVHQHPWMTTQTNSLCLPFGYQRSFTQKI